MDTLRRAKIAGGRRRKTRERELLIRALRRAATRLNYSRSLPTTCCFTLKGSDSALLALLRTFTSCARLQIPSSKSHRSPVTRHLSNRRTIAAESESIKKRGAFFLLRRHSSVLFSWMLAVRIRKRSAELVPRCSRCTKREKRER